MKSNKVLLVAVLGVSLAFGGPIGCAGGENQQAGTVLGAIAGGLAGAQFGRGTGQLVGVGIGTLLGAAIGGELGRSVDATDRRLMHQTTERALNDTPRNTTTTWRNPDTGHYGTVTPTNTTEPRSGVYCREYQQTVTVGGQTQNAFGTACRQPDGQWRVQ
ncbi:MAG: glycine zipper 2TM domain-containing protein [Parcubacteria group bacterium]|nr:glycine zipper 2TM domain-containing protein [Parcubacteria group bacterium]